MSADQWGNIVVTPSGLAFLTTAAIVGLEVPKLHLGRYLAVTGYLLLFPVHLWFWQFLLAKRGPLPGWCVPNAAQQIIVTGIVPLVWLCFRRP